jgi:hypothetical protein
VENDIMGLAICLRLLIALLVSGLAGCTTLNRAPDLASPNPVSENIWRQVDRDIVSESMAATDPAMRFARQQMEQWRQLVTLRVEADFIPWYASYGTQQWLAAKVAWYQLNSGDGGNPPVSRLAAYLQEQYHDRVLAPVAREVDPASVIGQATKLYIQRLRGQLQSIPARYGVPPVQFDWHLQNIPAIVLAPPPDHDASLYQIVYAEQIDGLPAYAALLRKIQEAQGDAGAGLSKSRISTLATRVSEEMMDRLAISGGTGAASALVGGIAGSIMSLGASVFGVIKHEADRTQIEMQLRETLNASMDDIWQILVESPSTGVTAGIQFLSDQIEKNPSQIFMQPVQLEQPPKEMPLQDK